jgi:hypothetical protein
MFGVKAFKRFWESAASPTKLAIAFGLVTLLAHVYNVWPVDSEQLVGLVFSAVTIFLSVYTIQCLVSGGCNKFAWLVSLAPVLMFMLTNFLYRIDGL